MNDASPLKDFSSAIEHLCKSYVHDIQILHEHNTYDTCQLLLCANDMQIDTPKIRNRIARLELEEASTDYGHEDLLQRILRLLVFSRFNAGEKSRQSFLDYWINQMNLRGKDIITVSFLVNLALENQDFLTPSAREYTRNWHVSHSEILSDRVVAWSVYCLQKTGHIEIALKRANDFLNKRKKNGSWDDDLPKTIACVYPLVLSTLVDSETLEQTMQYILSKLQRDFIYATANKASALKVLYRIGKIPSESYKWTYSRITNEGSIFLSHNSQDHPFVHRLADDLKSLGIQAWVDEAEILPGDILMQKIEAGITDMQYLGVVLSPRSVQSAWVRKELDMALVDGLQQHEIKVVPILSENCLIPLCLRDIRYADFSNDYQLGIRDLIRRLRPDLSYSE